MRTEQKRALQKRTNTRKKRVKKRASKVRAKENVFARTIHRTPAQATRLSHAVNTADIINARMERDKKLEIVPTVRKHKIDKPKLMTRNRGKNKFSMRALRTALANIEKDIDKVPIFEHFVRRAYENDNVLKALLSKLLPDLKSVDAKIVQETPFRLVIDLSDRPMLNPGEPE